MLSSINIGTTFVGADGLAADGGVTTHDETEARTNRAMIRRSRRVIVVADGRKIGHVTLARIVDVGDVDEVITDASADLNAIHALRQAGVTVTVAKA